MKNLSKIYFALVVFLLISNNAFLQADRSGPPAGLGHTGTSATWYCGWNAATPFPLNIRHDGTQDIDFYTGTVLGLPIQRMTILGTGAGVMNAGNVGIGTTTPANKLDVLENFGGIPYSLVGSTSPAYNTYVGTISISGINKDVSTAVSNIDILGIYGETSGIEPFSNGVTHTGGRFFASNATRIVGAEGIAEGINPFTITAFGGSFSATAPGVVVASQRIGVSGFANNGTPTFNALPLAFNRQIGVVGTAAGSVLGAGYYGGLFQATGPSGALQFGIFSAAPIGTTSWAGYFFGDVNITGTLTVSGLNVPSDAIIKTNINPITNASATLAALNPVNYNYNTSAVQQLSLDTGLHHGLIGQEVQNVLPEIVHSTVVPATYDSLGNILYPQATILSVNYPEIIPIVIAGHNEQEDRLNAQDSTIAALQEQNNNLQQQINDVVAAVNNCCSQGNNILAPNNNNGNGNNITNDTRINSQDVRLTENNTCILNTSNPNPVYDKAVITFKIPQTAGFAQIIFSNMLGEVIKIVDINERGEGRLNVLCEDLSSGMYNYTLMIDGNVCDTKKMIKE